MLACDKEREYLVEHVQMLMIFNTLLVVTSVFVKSTQYRRVGFN